MDERDIIQVERDPVPEQSLVWAGVFFSRKLFGRCMGAHCPGCSFCLAKGRRSKGERQSQGDCDIMASIQVAAIYAWVVRVSSYGAAVQTADAGS